MPLIGIFCFFWVSLSVRETPPAKKLKFFKRNEIYNNNTKLYTYKLKLKL